MVAAGAVAAGGVVPSEPLLHPMLLLLLLAWWVAPSGLTGPVVDWRRQFVAVPALLPAARFV